MGRYYTSEATRNPKLQKEAINYALSKATPFIKKTGSEMLDQLSTTIRPKRKYKTDRKDLDGGGTLRGQGLIDSLLSSVVQGSS